MPSNHTISIGKPTGKLKELIGDNELTITQKRLTRKSTIHDYTIQDIMNLPDFIDNPILLYESGDIKGRSLVIITDLSIGNNKIAIAINYHRDKTEVTEIKSIHQKSIERLLDDKNK